MAGTVSVACKLPNGLILRLFDMVDVTETPVGGAPRTVQQSRVRPGRVVIQGCGAPFGVAKVLHGGYALTHNVDADFFAEWMKQNAEAPVVKAGLIFAHEKSTMVEGKAREQAEIRSGMEPLKQKGDPRAPKRPNSNVSEIETATAA